MKQGLGHAAEPWKSYDILHDIEKASQNPAAAQKAKEQARELYLSYRNDGGAPTYLGGKLVDRDLGP